MLKQIKVELCDSWGKDRDVGNSAWASSKDIEAALLRPDEDVRRVVSQIVLQGHGTPKERVFFEFYVECPIFVERHFDKYRLTVQYQDFQIDYLVATPEMRVNITQNELSGRYRTIPERPYSLPIDVAQIQAKACAPTSVGYFQNSYSVMLQDQYGWYENELRGLKDAEKDGRITNDEYKRAREVLRGVLGTAFLTSMRIITNLHEFEHIINQRLSRHAQLESRVVAAQMVKLALPVAPVAIQTMIDANDWQPLMDEVFAAVQEDCDVPSVR